MNIEWHWIIYISATLILSRWSHRIATDMPKWLSIDWEHQATYFLATKNIAMDPKASQNINNDTLQSVTPPPVKAWYSPKSFDPASPWSYWIPFVGSWRQKDWRGVWSDAFSVLAAIAGVVIIQTTVAITPEVETQIGIQILLIPVFVNLLQALTTIDHRTQFLPDVLTYATLWIGLCLAAMGFSTISGTTAVLGAITGFGTLWLLGKGFSMLLGKDGMGGGDMKLAGAIGAWMGPMLAVTVLGLAAFIGLVYAIYYKWIVKRGEYFAFGPAIATAAVWMFLLLPVVKYATPS
jgi:prepilin signal peptidase PulO-like enzyme (type II secretory pathway)